MAAPPTLEWVRQNTGFDTTLFDANGFSRSMVVDTSGNTYTAYISTGVVPGGVNPGVGRVVVLKLDTTGTVVWISQQPIYSPTAGNAYYPSIAIDNNLNCYVTYFTDPDESVSGGISSGQYDVVLFKLDSTGTFQWARQQATFDTSGMDFSPQIAVGPTTGDSYVCYYTDGGVSGESNIGANDIVLFKYDTNGTFQWVRERATFNTDQNDTYPAIALDLSENPVVAYYTAGVVGGGPPTTSAHITLFKHDTTGNFLWAIQDPLYWSSASDSSPSLHISPTGSIFFAYNTLFGTVSGGTSAGNFDIVVAKLDSSGNFQWVVQNPAFNTPGADTNPSIITDTSDNCYIAYYTDSSVNGFTQTGGRDIVLFKLSPDGTHEWTVQDNTYNAGSGASNSLPTIGLDAGRNIYVQFSTDGQAPGQTNVGGVDVVVAKFRQAVAIDLLITIIGNGTVTLDAAPDVIVGPVSNYLITLTDPSFSSVIFTEAPASGWSFLAWSGDVTGTATTTTLTIPTLYSATFYVIATFNEVPPPPVIIRSGCIDFTQGDHESIRIRRVRECAEAQVPPVDANLDICPQCDLRPDFTPGTTPSERDRILREATACELYYLNQHTGGLCAGQREGIHTLQDPVATPADPLTGSRFTSHPPHRVHQYRTMTRPRGIEELARLVRGPSAAELTARRRQTIESSQARRHAEHFRAQPPPPERLQCTIIGGTPLGRHAQRSTAGIPTAPVSPCVLGNQRVDYSTGTF